MQTQAEFGMNQKRHGDPKYDDDRSRQVVYRLATRRMGPSLSPVSMGFPFPIFILRRGQAFPGLGDFQDNSGRQRRFWRPWLFFRIHSHAGRFHGFRRWRHLRIPHIESIPAFPAAHARSPTPADQRRAQGISGLARWALDEHEDIISNP